MDDNKHITAEEFIKRHDIPLRDQSKLRKKCRLAIEIYGLAGHRVILPHGNGFYVWNAENTGKWLYYSTMDKLTPEEAMARIQDKSYKQGHSAGYKQARKDIRTALGIIQADD